MKYSEYFTNCSKRFAQFLSVVIFFLLVVFHLPVSAQNAKPSDLTGFVTDSTKKPISSVTVEIRGKGTVASSNSKGNFSISLSQIKSFTLRHINYQSVEVDVDSISASSYHWVLQPKVNMLDVISVTASAKPIELRKIASSVSVLQKGAPELRQIQTIDEALAYLPGVSVDRSRGLTTTGTHTSVIMRGTGSANRTLILKDGVPINDAYTGGVSEWNSLAGNSIERIEVVRGPGSSIYGSNSMGGTINLVTQSPSDKPTLGADFRYGSMNTYQASVKAGKQFSDRWGAIVFAEYKKTDGYAYMADSLWKNYYVKPSMKLLNVNAKVAYHFPSAGTLTAIADYNLQQPLSGTTTIYDDRSVGGNYQLRYTNPAAVYAPDVLVYYNVQDRESNAIKWNQESNAFDERYYDSRVPLDTYGLIAKVHRTWGANVVTVGADIRFTEVVSRKYYYEQGIQDFTGRQDFVSFFVNDDLDITDRLHANIGLRYDHWANRNGKFFDNMSGNDIAIAYDNASSDIVNPKVGISYDLLHNLRLRAVYATGFRAPSSFYMYNAAPLGSSFRLGNPRLKPERMRYSYDIGVDFQLSDKLELSGTLYTSQYSDFLAAVLIDANEVPAYLDVKGLPVRQYINIGKVNLWGAESFARYRLTSDFSVQASYFYNSSEIKRYETNPEYEGNDMSDNPSHNVSGAFIFDRVQLFHLSLWGRHTGTYYGDLENTPEKTMPAVTVFDIKFGKAIGPLTLNVNVTNLFDKRYYGSYTSPTSYYYAPGRSVFAGITYQL
ncbi:MULTISPECIES: TonB-dependent receptor [Olivibacter]|jgi:iron complex outermembrane receptor protein|uniref:TonB-dependent receptor domain-containing protein n=1 Tax=Olivibacter oleidegradans TaxID=760123 RepID=A0ABV6HHZ5_9SPHI|nr:MULTISPECIES: TonB-dependent receptor [Olivibacter]MDM8176891.1 TonB-dependent receptor [Olivibacter sp. 47]QEL00655.1 TonB-dependent receptor [Olivibacter sp. LS-1]